MDAPQAESGPEIDRRRLLKRALQWLAAAGARHFSLPAAPLHRPPDSAQTPNR